MPNLTVRDGGKDFIHQIEGETASIGRADTNTIPIQDAKASKEHCRIECVGHRWKVIDLESKNGTRVNGDFCNKAWLKHGDTIRIGKAEIRFGMEGGTRRSERAAAPAGPRRPPPDEEYDDEAPPPRRRYGRSANDKLLMVGLFLLGAVVVFVVASKMASSLDEDKFNLGLIKEAGKMMQRDQWREALAYLQEHGDPDGTAYRQVQERMRDIEARMDDFYRNRDEGRAKKILSALSRKIKAYHAGKHGAQPDQILKMVEELKKKYPGTEATRLANESYRAWFAGRVPERASDVIRSGGQLLKDFQEAEDRAHEYVKKWQFREARESVEIFLTAREAILDAADVEHYKKKVDQALRRIDLSADGIYRARERIAWNLEKNKRFDQAIAVYREIIEKFGIDLYVRKAQQEILKIEKKKKQKGNG